MKKYFFEQFKKQIAKENKDLEAHHESVEIKTDRCDHSKCYIEQDKLKCPCGAVWQGPGIDKAYRHLTGMI